MMTELAPPLASIRPPSMQAVIEATGLRTLENVLRLIDPAILEESPPERRRSAPRRRVRPALADPDTGCVTKQSRARRLSALSRHTRAGTKRRSQRPARAAYSCAGASSSSYSDARLRAIVGQA